MSQARQHKSEILVLGKLRQDDCGWGRLGLLSEFTASLCCIDSVKSFTQKREKEEERKRRRRKKMMDKSLTL